MDLWYPRPLWVLEDPETLLYQVSHPVLSHPVDLQDPEPQVPLWQVSPPSGRRSQVPSLTAFVDERWMQGQ